MDELPREGCAVSPELLRVENLQKTYGHGDIFSDVSFTLDPGKTVGFFGMSGSGKSTLCRCILCLERPTRGSVWFEGMEISALRGRGLARVRPRMQMIFQHPEVSLNPRWRLFDSVTEPLAFHQRRDPEEVFEDLMPLIRAVGLRREQFFRYPHQLSGGEIQRAMMVRIYSLAPRLIVADEPTSMLDMSVQAQVLSLMKDLQRKNTTACIFVSHDPAVMQVMCDSVVVLERGRSRFMDMEEFAAFVEGV